MTKLIAARMTLMGKHNRRFDARAVFFGRVGFDGFKFGKRLKTVFAHKSRKLFFVFLVRLFGVPNLPIMHVADSLENPNPPENLSLDCSANRAATGRIHPKLRDKPDKNFR